MLKLLKLACALTVAAVVLAGCNQGSSGTSTGAPNSPSPTPTSVSPPVPTSTGSATLSWVAPTTTTSGAALTDLAGYVIYYGSSATSLSQSVQIATVGMQTYVLDNLTAGTWYFAIAAVTNTGAQSALSNIVSKTIG